MGVRARPEFVTGLLGSAVILTIFVSPIFRGEVHTHDDLSNFHLPIRAYYASHLAQGEIPTWIPNLFCGFNLHGEGQIGLLHPIHLLLYGLLPLRFAFMLEVVLPFLIMQAGVYAFLKRQRLGSEAAIFGSILFTFAPSLMLRFVHVNATAILAHLPWLLVTIEIFVQSSGRKRALAGLAVSGLTASQVLLGYPAYLWYSALAEAFFALWLTAPSLNWRALASLAVSKILGVLLGAIQLLPTFEQLAHSVRREPMALNGDLTSRRDLFILSQWLDPYLVWYRVPLPTIPQHNSYFYIHEASFYCGAAVPVLLVWVALRWRRGEIDRRLTGAAAAFCALVLCLAFIRLTPLWEYYRRIPVLGLFRLNLRYFVLFVLGSAVIAAAGLADLIGMVRRGERRDWKSLWPLFVAPLLSTGLAFAALIVANHRPGLRIALSSWPLLLLGPVLSWLASLVVVAAARGRSWAPTALVLLTAADLGYCNLSHVFSPFESRPATPVTSTIPNLIAKLPDPPHGPGHRFLDEASTDRLLLKGLRLAGGYVGLTPFQSLNYAHDPVARRVAGVGAILLDVKEGVPLRWEPAPDPLPRARLVTQAQVSRDPGHDLAGIDPATVALVPQTLELPPGVPGTASIDRDDATRIEVTTSATSRQLLVLAESNAPGWEVRVDGQTGEVVPSYGDFLGCVVPAGRHKIEFRYRSQSLRFGALISTSALGLIGIWFAFGWRSVRRKSSSPSDTPSNEVIPDSHRLTNAQVVLPESIRSPFSDPE